MTKMIELRKVRKDLLLSNGTLDDLQDVLVGLQDMDLEGLDDAFADVGIVGVDEARKLIQVRIKCFANGGYFGYVESLCYDLRLLDDYPDEDFWIINEYNRLEYVNEAAVEDVLDELID